MKHGYAPKHGPRRTEYTIWNGIKARCFRPNDPLYSYYGGRGITMCDRWRCDFLAFLGDMGPRPEGHSIERINNNGNYEPGNCKWATRGEQANNRRIRRDSIVVPYRGKQIRLADVATENGIPYRRLYNRLYSIFLRGHMPSESAVMRAVAVGRSCQ